MSDKIDSRRKDFKKGVDVENGRRRREETTIRLRKDKREDALAKRRNVNISNDASEQPHDSTKDQQQQPRKTIKDIPELVAAMNGADQSAYLDATRGIRRLLSVDNNPPVDLVLEAGILPRFVEFLGPVYSPELQFEAAWALTNIASTEKTRVLLEAGAITPLIALMMSSNADVRDQSAWCLGNIAGDCSELRDAVLECGIMQPLLQNIAQPANKTLLRNATWTLSNLCRGKPHPNPEHIQPAMPAFSYLLTIDDDDIRVDATWALSYLADGSEERINVVLQSGVIAPMMQTLQSALAVDPPNQRLITPILRTFGNIVSGTDHQTQAVIDHGILAHSLALLGSGKKSIRKEACWMLSNIAAGTKEQITALCSPAYGLLGAIVDLCVGDEWEVKKEALYVVTNLLLGGNTHQVASLVEFQVIPALCAMLEVSDVRLIEVALEGLESLLKKGGQMEGSNAQEEYSLLIDEAGGVDALESLQAHANQKIYEKSVALLEQYFHGEEEDEHDDEDGNGNAFGSENFAPQEMTTADGTAATFSFGLKPKQLEQLDGQNTNSNSNSNPATTNKFDFSQGNQAFGANNCNSNPFGASQPISFNFS